MQCYEALDEGNHNLLEKKLQASKTLYLKLNCPVMLIKNLSDSLVNGLQGVVVDLKPNAVTVKF